MRNYVLASFVGHLILTVVGSVVSVAFQDPIPPANLIRVDLATLAPELPKPEPEITKPPPEEEEKPEEAPVIPPVPAEVADRRPMPEFDEGNDIPEDDGRELQLAPPDPDLPPAPEVRKPEEDLDFLDPEDVQPVASSETEVDESLPDPEQQPAGEIDAIQVKSQDGIPDYYLMLIHRKINARWEASAARRRGSREAVCVVRFRIDRAGQIVEPRILQSSGLSVFDREALRAVTSSSPLPPPPARSVAAEVFIDVGFNLTR